MADQMDVLKEKIAAANLTTGFVGGKNRNESEYFI